MSNRTNEINKITTTIISISVKLIVYALIVLLLYEAVAKGYAFGHEVFYAEAVDEAPGRDVTVQIDQEESVSEAAGLLSKKGLIKSEFAFIFQGKFYDYETVYPGTYVLNTSMTSKEILQMLNEKPEEEASPAQSGNAKARPAAETAPASAETAAGTETSGAAQEGSQVPAPASGNSGEDAFGEENDYYGDEDQEMEGGWIEDAAEDGEQ
ncbi:MAG: endolytic transglycosylase MltG [Clostridium sp.]|nr:endolytic transglycosylase MltG [Clostridium sp.]